MALVGVLVWIDEDEYDRLYGELINMETFIECDITERIVPDDIVALKQELEED